MSCLKVQANQGVGVWPMKLDFDRHKCGQIIRRLELEAYGKIVAVFRAQGLLTREKRKCLRRLQYFLNISSDRHKVEVRRVLNDEELTTISEILCGKETGDEWLAEGRRIAPILHRPSPNTAYLSLADEAATGLSVTNLCSTSGLEPSPAISKPYTRVRREHRVFNTLFNLSKSKPVTADKHTEISASLNVSPIPEENLFSDLPISTASIPRVGCEVTCETDDVNPPPSSLPNGHVTRVSESSITHEQPSSLVHTFTPVMIKQMTNPRPTNLSQGEFPLTAANSIRVRLSNENVPEVESTRPSLPMTLLTSPRKRSASADLTAEPLQTITADMMRTPELVKPVVHYFSTPTDRLSTGVSSILSKSPRPNLPTNLQRSYSTIPVSTIKTTFQMSQPPMNAVVPIQHSLSQPSRLQPQLVIQVSRSSSNTDPFNISDPLPVRQRLSISSTPVGSTRPIDSAFIGSSASHSLPSKPSYVRPSLHPIQSTQQHVLHPDVVADMRKHTISATPSISSIHSFHGTPSSSQLSSVNSLVVQHIDPHRRLSSLSSISTPSLKVPISVSVLHSSSNPPNHITDDVVNTPTAKRLVCATSTAVLSPAVSNSLSTGSNIVVFQRGTNRKNANIPLPSIKLKSVTGTSVVAATTIHVNSPNLPPIARHVRVMNLPHPTPSHPSASVTSNTEQVVVVGDAALTTTTCSNPPDSLISVLTVQSDASALTSPANKLSDETVQALLQRASSISMDLDVDLDADDESVPISKYPDVTPEQSEQRFNFSNPSFDNQVVCSSNSLLTNPATPEDQFVQSKSFTLNKVSAGGHLRAILGSNSHTFPKTSDCVSPVGSMTDLSNISPNYQMVTVHDEWLTDDANTGLGSPEPKRARLSPSMFYPISEDDNTEADLGAPFQSLQLPDSPMEDE